MAAHASHTGRTITCANDRCAAINRFCRADYLTTAGASVLVIADQQPYGVAHDRTTRVTTRPARGARPASSAPPPPPPQPPPAATAAAAAVRDRRRPPPSPTKEVRPWALHARRPRRLRQQRREDLGPDRPLRWHRRRLHRSAGRACWSRATSRRRCGPTRSRRSTSRSPGASSSIVATILGVLLVRHPVLPAADRLGRRHRVQHHRRHEGQRGPAVHVPDDRCAW